MMNHTSDAIDERLLPGTATRRAVAGCPAEHGWRAVGVVFLVVSLLALSAGAFFGFFLPAHLSGNRFGSPALQVLISVQAVFLIMFWPLPVVRPSKKVGWHLQPERSGGCGCRMRQERKAPTSSASLRSAPLEGATRQLGFLFRSAAEYIIFLAVSIPLYVVAAYLSDATATDVIRSLLYLSAVATGAMGLGLWAQAGRVSIITAVTLAGALIAVGGPVLCYLLVELTDASMSAGWLWRGSPATCAFESAAARGANWYPTPIWAWALWPVVGIALTFTFLMVHGSKKKK